MHHQSSKKVDSLATLCSLYKVALSFDCVSFNILFWAIEYLVVFLVLQNLLAPPPKHIKIQEGLSFECSNCHNLLSLLVEAVANYWSHFS